MNLSRKLLGGFAALIALVALLSCGAFVVISNLTGDLERAANVTARKEYLAGDVNAAASQISSIEKGAVIASVLGDKTLSDATLQQFSEPASRLRKGLADLRAMAANEQTMSRLQALEREASSVTATHEELRQAMQRQQLDAALAIFAQKVQPRLEEIGRQAASLVDEQNADLAAASEAAFVKSSRLRVLTIAFMLIATLVGGAVFWIVTHTNTTLRAMTERLSDSAEHVALAASQVSGAGHALAEGATEQAASLEETSSSTEEIASITRKNAESALQVAGLMQNTEASAKEVNQTLDQMVEQMKQINSSSNKIARIIKVIDEIAFQTNILALNAAVEAARAGEAGLGFAVVADEVRNLAQRCAQAARDTAELIAESIATSHDGNSRLDLMAGAVRSMTGNSTRVKTLVDEVNIGSQEQSRGMDQIAHAVTQMQQVTQRTAAGAEESASSGTELSSHASVLRGLVKEMQQMVGAS